MAKNIPQQDPEDARTDLLAAMAASRELGPEMDKAIVDSYMEKHKLAIQPATTQPPAPAQRMQSGELISFLCMGIGLVAFITLVIVSHGFLWWMFWPLMGWAGWRWSRGSWGGNHENQGINQGTYQSARDQYRQARWEYRMQRRATRYGLPYPQNGYQQQPQQPALPPQNVQPQYQQPQYQQPQYPQQYPQYQAPAQQYPQYQAPQAPVPAPAQPPVPAPPAPTAHAED